MLSWAPLSAAGITTPFAVQNLAIGDVLAGRDALVRSPTGSGKTLAFGVPLVDRTAADARRPAALVLAPTRELATQITEDIRSIAHARALRVTAVYGGVGLTAQAKNAARSHILVATPGRLEDLLARGAFTLDAVRMLVLDEADRMLDMGFKPAVDRIVRACPPTARRCSSPPRSTARRAESPAATRRTRSSTSTDRPRGARPRTSSTASRPCTASTAWTRSSTSSRQSAS